MMKAKGVGSPIAEEIIRENVRIFRHYLEKAIMVTDLVGHCELYTREQKNELLQISKSSQAEATRRALEMIDQLSHPSKYTHLLDVLEEADYPKLVGLLQGKLVRVHDNHRIRLNEVTSLLYQRLNTSDVLPFLQQTGVIALEEANTIRKVETHRSRGDSALELQYILPNRHRHWYELMIWSLVESGQTELAEKIDGSLTKAILEGETTKLPQCRPAISLQSIISAGSREKLTDATEYRAQKHIQKDAHHSANLQRGDNYQGAYRSYTELDAIFTTTEHLYEKLEHFLENSTNNDIPNGSSEMSCRKRIQWIQGKITNVSSMLEEYLNNHEPSGEQTQLKLVEAPKQQLSKLEESEFLKEYLSNHERSGDQTQLKLVEAPKQQGKTIFKHTKSVGRSKGLRHENDMHDSVIVTDTGFPYKILAPGRKVSSPAGTIVGISPDRTIVSPGTMIDSPGRKIASQKSKTATLDRTIQSPEQQILEANTCKKVSSPSTTNGHITTPDGDMRTSDLNYLSPDRKTSQPDKITSSASKIQAINANNVLPDKKMLYPHVKMEKLDIAQLKLADDEHTPHITGCVLMPSTDIVVCDFYNRKVKLFDQSRKITDSIRLPWAPRDLSLVDDETVTVTIPSIRRIQYVKVFPKMKAFCGIQLDQCLERQKTIAFSNESNCTCHQTGIV